jgi:hypothetical protein
MQIKKEMIRKIGLIMIVIGISSALVGTFIVYTSLRDYSQCILAPSSECTVTEPILVQYLNRQQVGNSATLYGLVLLILGAIFYSSSRVEKVEPDVVSIVAKGGVHDSEESANSPKNYSLA